MTTMPPLYLRNNRNGKVYRYHGVDRYRYMRLYQKLDTATYAVLSVSPHRLQNVHESAQWLRWQAFDDDPRFPAVDIDL